MKVPSCAAILVIVDDLAHCAATLTPTGVAIGNERRDIDIDRDAEIDFAHALERSQALEVHLWVAFGVASHNDLAATSDKLVDAEVLEMPAIGHHDEVGTIVSARK